LHAQFDSHASVAMLNRGRVLRLEGFSLCVLKAKQRLPRIIELTFHLKVHFSTLLEPSIQPETNFTHKYFLVYPVPMSSTRPSFIIADKRMMMQENGCRKQCPN